MQPPPLSSSKTLSWPRKKILFPLISYSPFPPLPGPQGVLFLHILANTCYFQFLLLLQTSYWVWSGSSTLSWFAFLMTNDEHLAICLLVICISHLEKFHFSSLHIFWLDCSSFCWWAIIVLYIFQILDPFHTSDIQITLATLSSFPSCLFPITTSMLPSKVIF